MRIGLLTTQYPNARLGGIGTYTVNAAAALAHAGHDVHIFTLTLPEDARAKTPPGVQLHEISDLAIDAATGKLPALSLPAVQAASAGGDGMYRLAVAWRFFTAVAAVHNHTPFNVIEAPEYEALGLPFLFQPLSPRAAIVTQLHSGSAINRQGNQTPATPADELIDALEAAAILGAHALTAPTAAVTKATSQTLLEGAPLDATIIPLPYPAPAAPFMPPPENGTILYVGRIERLKGADLLGAAASKVLAACPARTIQLIGPDTPTAPAGGSMQRHVQSLLPPELSPRFIFAGEKNSGAVRQAMQQASVVVIPSRCENFSQVACEALAAGRPIVCAADTGPAEFVGGAGVLFANGDSDSLARALIDLCSNPQRIQSLARGAYDHARSALSVDAVIPQRESLYAAAIAAAQSNATRPRLANLPPRHAPAILKALTLMTGVLLEAPIDRPPTPGLRLLQIMERLGPNTPVMLYGAGRYTTRLLAERNLWESRGHSVVGLIDDHPRFANIKEWLGLPVVSRAVIEERLEKKQPVPVVVLSTDTFKQQFWDQLQSARQKGLRVEVEQG